MVKQRRKLPLCFLIAVVLTTLVFTGGGAVSAAPAGPHSPGADLPVALLAPFSGPASLLGPLASEGVTLAIE